MRIRVPDENDNRGGSVVDTRFRSYGAIGVDPVRLSSIYSPIQGDLDAARKQLRVEVHSLVAKYSESTAGGVALTAIEHLFGTNGKSLRPALLLLSAGATRPEGYGRRQAARLAAGIVELIHSASLIHDDVIDESIHRRKALSVHKKYGVKIAILAGDILFSHGFEVLAALPDTPDAMKLELLSHFADLTKQMCYGEIFEQQSSGGTDSFERYLDIIELKTARLMSVSCRVGSVLAGGDVEEAELCGRIGLNFGLAYQLVDDKTDKDSIYTGALDYVEAARDYMKKAEVALLRLPSSPYRRSLSALCEFIFQ